MSAVPPGGSAPLDDEVAPVVAVTRTVGGIVLALVGVALVLAGAFWFFLVPWFGWAMEGFWFTMAEWADLGGAAVGILGFLLLIVGGALVQRARKRRLQIFMDASDLAAMNDTLREVGDASAKPGTSPPPTTIV